MNLVLSIGLPRFARNDVRTEMTAIMPLNY